MRDRQAPPDCISPVTGSQWAATGAAGRQLSEPAFLTVPQLAAVLGAKVSRVYEWTRAVGADTIPCYKAGKCLVFDPEEALTWFKRTQRKETFGGRFRVAPNSRPDGQRRKRPVRKRVSANGQAAVAITLPREV
jgi:hypothetical protein